MTGSSTYANYQDEKANKPLCLWHDAIIDDLIIYPFATMNERAARLDYTPKYLSVIINSDMFQAAYEHRRKEFSRIIDHALVTKMSEVAVKTLDLMSEVLDEKRTAIPFAALSETADRTLARLGYGAKQNGTTVNVMGDNTKVAVLPTVSAESLADARQALRAAEQARALEPPAVRSEAPALELEVLPPDPESR